MTNEKNEPLHVQKTLKAYNVFIMPHLVALLVTCLTAEACLTEDPGVESLIPAQSHTFVEIDHEFLAGILLPSADSRIVVVSYKQKYVSQVLVYLFVKLAKERSVVRWTNCPNMAIAVD